MVNDDSRNAGDHNLRLSDYRVGDTSNPGTGAWAIGVTATVTILSVVAFYAGVAVGKATVKRQKTTTFQTSHGEVKIVN